MQEAFAAFVVYMHRARQLPAYPAQQLLRQLSRHCCERTVTPQEANTPIVAFGTVAVHAPPIALEAYHKYTIGPPIVENIGCASATLLPGANDLGLLQS